MKKKEYREKMNTALDNFIAAGGEVKQLPPEINLEFDSYQRQAAYRSQLNRSSGGQPHRARSIFFKKGEGTI